VTQSEAIGIVIPESSSATYIQTGEYHNPPAAVLQSSIAIGSIVDSGWVIHVIVSDLTEALVLDSKNAATFQARVFGDYLIVEWSWNDGNNKPLHTVSLLILISSLLGLTMPQEPDYGLLVQRVVVNRANKIRRIFVRQDDIPVEITGSVLLDGGYNAELEVGAPGESQRTLSDNILGTPQPNIKRNSVTFTLEAGSGLGKYPDCDFPPIRTINGIAPGSHGDFLLSADSCYWFEVPGEVVNGAYIIAGDNLGKINLHSGCGSCCRCQQYYNLYNQLTNLWAREKVVLTRLRNVYDTYTAIRKEFLQLCPENPDTYTWAGGNWQFKFQVFTQPGWTAGLSVMWKNNTRFTGSGHYSPVGFHPAPLPDPADLFDPDDTFYHAMDLRIGMLPGHEADINVFDNDTSAKYFEVSGDKAERHRSWKPQGETLRVITLGDDIPLIDSKTAWLNNGLEKDIVYFHPKYSRVFYVATEAIPPQEYETVQVTFVCKDFEMSSLALYTDAGANRSTWRDFVTQDYLQADGNPNQVNFFAYNWIRYGWPWILSDFGELDRLHWAPFSNDPSDPNYYYTTWDWMIIQPSDRLAKGRVLAPVNRDS
jgi:hypothetical protein